MGGGVLWRQAWKKTAEQESKQETDTPSFLKVIAAYSVELLLSELHKTPPVVHEDTKKQQFKENKLQKNTAEMESTEMSDSVDSSRW